MILAICVHETKCTNRWQMLYFKYVYKQIQCQLTSKIIKITSNISTQNCVIRSSKRFCAFQIINWRWILSMHSTLPRSIIMFFIPFSIATNFKQLDYLQWNQIYTVKARELICDEIFNENGGFTYFERIYSQNRLNCALRNKNTQVAMVSCAFIRIQKDEFKPYKFQ